MRPVLLVIMDGVGYREETEGNAVLNANTPNLDRLWNTCPHRLIRAHGHYVGLPTDEDMGNSEVGHNALGCGQIYSQGAKLVNEAISNNTMYESETWKKLVSFCKDNGVMHFIGLLSDGNVHSHINHLLSLLEQSKKEGLKKVRVHILLDGRDVPPTSALDYVKILESKMDSLNDENFDSRIASGGGRMYITMDRYEADWKMVERGWHTHVLGDARHFKSAYEAITTMREENSNMDDQNLLNFVIVDENDNPVGTINDNDSVIFYNFRGDRALEISESFDDEVFTKYDRIRYPKAMYAGMLEYDADKHIPKMFLTEPPKITNTLTEELNKHNIHEFAISETQKYGHVTYFWNGNKLGKFNEELEDYVEVPSSKLPFPEQPEMKAKEITDALIPAILSNKYEFLRVNYANGDMIGHTGIYEKTVKAIETVDREIGRLIEAIDKVNGIMIILADHGNSEIMYQLKDIDKHIPHTSHTTSPVPFIVYGENVTIKDGDYGLANIASTICTLLNIEPNNSWKESIIKKLGN
jgi:2,3-bisphosphoglycerate-independent phosphoglycerate mutase